MQTDYGAAQRRRAFSFMLILIIPITHKGKNNILAEKDY